MKCVSKRCQNEGPPHPEYGFFLCEECVNSQVDRTVSGYRQKVAEMAERPWMKVKDMVIAFLEQHPRNEVVFAGTMRYRLTEEITREEFLAQLRENAKYGDHVAAEAPVSGQQVDVAGAVDMVTDPGPEFTHYYRAVVI